MPRQGFALLLFLALTRSPGAHAEKLIHVVVQRTAEGNGSDPSTATAQAFVDQINAANLIYKSADMQFRFDPAKDFPPVVNSPLLHRDLSFVPGQDLKDKNTVPKVSDALFTLAKEEYAAKHFPGKLVIYSGAGSSPPKWSDAKGSWVLDRVDGAYSGKAVSYVRWHWYDDARRDLFAHEVGHFLHLDHSFGAQPANLAELQSLAARWRKDGWKETEIPGLFDADGGTVTDTPADPGAAFYQSFSGKPASDCDAGPIKTSYLYEGKSYPLEFQTDQQNIMSYFFCTGKTMRLSPQQRARVRDALEFGNRYRLSSHLFNGDVLRYDATLPVQSLGVNHLLLAASGADNRLVTKSYHPTEGWQPGLSGAWNDHRSLMLGRPSIVSRTAGIADIFVLTKSARVAHLAYVNGAWVPAWNQPEDLGTAVAGLNSVPAAASWGPSHIHLFARGIGGNIYGKAWMGSGWVPSQTGWNDFGGPVGGEPTVISWGEGNYNVFVRGTAGEVLQKAWDGKAWRPSVSGWASLGGIIPEGARIAAVSWAKGRVDLVVRGMDNSVWHLAYDGKSWLPWRSLGGRITGDPGIVSWGPNRLDIVARDTNGHLIHKAWDGDRWYPSPDGWEDLGGPLHPHHSPTITSWGPGRLDIFVRSTSSNVLHKAWTGSDWYPSPKGWEDQGRDLN